MCTTIVGSKTWNFFKTLSEWKKALKATALKTLRKGMGKLYWAKVKVGSKRLRLKQGKNSVIMLDNKKFFFIPSFPGSKDLFKKTLSKLGEKVLGTAEEPTKLGSKLAGKSAGKILSKVGFGVLDVGFGIWDIIDSAKDIREGSAQAKEFRKGAEAIVERKKEINELFNNITKRCDTTAKKVCCAKLCHKSCMLLNLSSLLGGLQFH